MEMVMAWWGGGGSTVAAIVVVQVVDADDVLPIQLFSNYNLISLDGTVHCILYLLRRTSCCNMEH